MTVIPSLITYSNLQFGTNMSVVMAWITYLGHAAHDLLSICVVVATFCIAFLLCLRCYKEKSCVLLDCIFTVVPPAKEVFTQAWKGLTGVDSEQDVEASAPTEDIELGDISPQDSASCTSYRKSTPPPAYLK